MKVPEWVFRYELPLYGKWLVLREVVGGRRGWALVNSSEVPKGATPVTTQITVACDFSVGVPLEEGPTVEVLGNTYYQIDVEEALSGCAVVKEE